MAYCEFLLRDESKSCAGCTGWFCTSKGSRKKLADVDYCRDYRDECSRYLAVYPKPPEERDFISTDDVIELPPTEETTSVSGSVDTLTFKVEIPAAPPLIVQPPPTDCPYLGPIPEGCHGCCDVWCYANDSSLRSFKHCRSPPTWRECRFRIQAERRGVKHALG